MAQRYQKIGAEFLQTDGGESGREVPCDSENQKACEIQVRAEKKEAESSSSSLKLAILVSVTLQNSIYALIRGYSRGVLKETYSASSALVVMEVGKMLLACYQVAYAGLPSDVPAGSALSKYVFLIRNSAKMLVPAVAYLIMNLLSFFALGKIDASSFSLIAQLKVLATALSSVGLLGRPLSPRKWRALGTLTLGVILVADEAAPSSDGSQSQALEAEKYLIGLAATFAEVMISGLICVYFEKVLKDTKEVFSVWDRNLQLAFWSIAIYLPITMYEEPSDPFHGWSAVTFGCAFLGMLGGVLVALSIKHTDSIMKTIATTGALVLTTGLNAAFFNGPRNLPMLVGGLIVIVSVFSYSDNGDA